MSHLVACRLLPSKDARQILVAVDQSNRKESGRKGCFRSNIIDALLLRATRSPLLELGRSTSCEPVLRHARSNISSPQQPFGPTLARPAAALGASSTPMKSPTAAGPCCTPVDIVDAQRRADYTKSTFRGQISLA